jgi:signal peptidase I
MAKSDTAPTSETAAKASYKPDGTRDGIEAVVIAFILAFLFRTFEAEAFVIPTGSMAPGLMGAHHDLYCEQCGYRYQVNTSENDEKSALEYSRDMHELQTEHKKAVAAGNRALANDYERRIGLTQESYANRRTVEGTCPVCRYTTNFAKKTDGKYKAFSGDRLIVTKFPYEFGEPKRFDVAVFKYPLGPSENFIKRIVGLPNENIRIFHGDLFTSPAGSNEAMTIARKPDKKLLGMAQIVHDNDYVVRPDGKPDELIAAGWPARWHAGVWTDGDAGLQFAPASTGWNADENGRGFTYSATDSASGDDVWLRYEHTVPNSEVWADFEKTKQLPSETAAPRRPLLISDFYAYNTNLDLNDTLGFSGNADGRRAVGLGVHWVGDLMLECELTVKQVDADAGAVTLELVEGSTSNATGDRTPCRFQCHIDLKTGEARVTALGIPGDASTGKPWEAIAQTSVRGPGTYELRFSNFDDELRLWVDGSRVEFKDSTAYHFASADPRDRNNRPTEADLAPAGIQFTGAAASVDHLRVKRDIYYIATRGNEYRVLEDYQDNEVLIVNPSEQTQREAMSNPAMWGQFEKLQQVEFTTGPDDFLALGDNSPHSADGRLWGSDPFVPRRLLIGEAMFIYWPHSWFFPVPNVKDMEFVK